MLVRGKKWKNLTDNPCYLWSRVYTPFKFLSFLNYNTMSIRSQAILPESLKHALELRQTTVKCRADVEAALSKYGLIRGPGIGMAAPRSVAPPPAPSNRFTNLGSVAAPDGWRTKATPRQSEEEDRWVTAHHSKKRGGGSSGGMNNFRRTERHEFSRESRETPRDTQPSVSGGAGSGASVGGAGGASGAWRSSRFQPLEDTIANESMEDRIMGKVRAKVNKLGHSTYDATKAFMKQILDSGETDFLDEFMRFVFGKAATEPAFCGLYARFLHELADEFPHLRTAMISKFREYTRVFDEASKAPDVGTSDYKAFVEAQEQKKFRRGYSQFVAELAKIGEVSMEDFRLLVNRVVETIQVCYVKEENRSMCEEVVDCFMMMVRAGKVDWMREYVDTLRSITAVPKDAAPGLSNKGRFAIMDILDLVTKARQTK